MHLRDKLVFFSMLEGITMEAYGIPKESTKSLFNIVSWEGKVKSEKLSVWTLADITM